MKTITIDLKPVVREQRKPLGFAVKNVAAGGILEDETVESVITSEPCTADQLFMEERVKEIRERIEFADQTLSDGIPLENLAVDDPDVAHEVVMDQLEHYKIISNTVEAREPWVYRWDFEGTY